MLIEFTITMWTFHHRIIFYFLQHGNLLRINFLIPIFLQHGPEGQGLHFPLRNLFPLLKTFIFFSIFPIDSFTFLFTFLLTFALTITLSLICMNIIVIMIGIFMSDKYLSFTSKNPLTNGHVGGQTLGVEFTTTWRTWFQRLGPWSSGLRGDKGLFWPWEGFFNLGLLISV